MHIPVELYRSALEDESYAIALRQRETEFESVSLQEPPRNPSAKDFIPVFFNNVHVVMGERNPWLRRVEFFNPQIPPRAATEILTEALASIKDSQSVVPEGEYKEVVKSVTAACEETEAVNESASSIVIPFTTIGLLAVYATDQGDPFANEFSLRAFARSLEKHVEIPEIMQTPTALPEGLLRLAYDMETEHKENVSSFEEWQAEVRNSIGEVENPQRAVSSAYMSRLLLPAAATHPTINRRLFEAN
jgi:hypothetical protein